MSIRRMAIDGEGLGMGHNFPISEKLVKRYTHAEPKVTYYMRAFVTLFFFCWVITLFLPWWSLLVPAVIVGAWLFEQNLRAFVIGFAAAGLAWFVQALYIHIANDAILSTRMAETLGVGSPWALLLITFIVGGLPGAFGTLLGFRFKRLLQPTESTQTV